MDYLTIGKIHGSHGLKGFVKVRCYSSEKDYLRAIEFMYLQFSDKMVAHRIMEMNSGGKDLLVLFEGMNTQEDTKNIIGKDVFLPREKCSPLTRNEYYYADLFECSLKYKRVWRGCVRSVCESGECVYLEIQNNNGVFLVPFNKYFISRVNKKRKTIYLKKDWDFL